MTDNSGASPALSALPVKPPQLGLYAWFGLPVPILDRIAMIRDAGFESTALWWEEDDERRRRLRHLVPDLVRRSGLHIDNLHAPYAGCNTLWSANPIDREAMVHRHIGWVEDCGRHDVDTLVMHVTQGTGTPPPNTFGLDSLRRIVEAGEASGVTIAIENTRSAIHIEWLLERIPSPRLGLCYDSSHDWLYSETPGDLLLRWGSRIVATHFSDTDGRRDQHWLPQLGVIDFHTIRSAGPWPTFGGCFMLEVVPKDRKQSAADFLHDAYHAAQRLASDLAA
jgi:sugar phosphate isomerase/epimerase